LHWEEIDSSVVGQPICNQCYGELRELLIDRADEIESVIAQGLAVEEQALIAQALSAKLRVQNQIAG
jgi:hypothetical protein